MSHISRKRLPSYSPRGCLYYGYCGQFGLSILFLSSLSELEQHVIFVNCSGLEITAGQRTMSELIWELTGQPFVLPVMLTGHIWLFWKWNKATFPCCSVVSVVASRCVLSFVELWFEILGEMQQELLFTIRALKTDIKVHALPAHPS